MAKAQGQSELRQLRVLATSHRGILNCVAQIKKFDEDVIQKSEDMNSESAPVSSSATVSVTMDRCLEDLFAPYTEKDKYFKQESKVLELAFEDLLAKFHEYQVII